MGKWYTYIRAKCPELINTIWTKYTEKCLGV